jgi:hypothetical protein
VRHLGKFFIVLIVLTSSMLLFVHQQIAIIQCSYAINQNESLLGDLKEKNKNLRFQLASYTSPTSLNEKLAAADINLVFPDQITVVKIPAVFETPLHLVDANTRSGSESFSIFKALGFDREAHAQVSVE